MRIVNFNGFDNIFSELYPYKITVLGVAVRIVIPKNDTKYSEKRVIHVYIKTHGKLLELTETFEEGNESRLRVALNKTNKFKIPKYKKSSQYIYTVGYYIPNKQEISFNEFKSSAMEKSTCEIFEIFLKDTVETGIVLNYDNLTKVCYDTFLNNL